MKHLLAPLLLLSLAAPAQQAPATATPQTRVARTTISADMPPAQRAEQLTTRLTRQLKLTPDQIPRVQAASLKQAQAMQALLQKHNGLRSHETLTQEANALQEAYAAELKTVLTPAQYDQYVMSQQRLRTMREQSAPTSTPGH